jgi:sec-independent protein translocase protein TatA
MHQLAFFNLPGGLEWIVVGAVALLVFGRRLPEVARSVGKSIVEFKRGLREVKDEIDVQSRLEAPTDEKPAGADSTQPKQEQTEKQAREEFLAGS